MGYVINLDVRQSRQANDSASIVKHANERFHLQNYPRKSISLNKFFAPMAISKI